jgi:hypothetical protein
MIDFKPDEYVATSDAVGRPPSARGRNPRFLRGGVLVSLLALVALFICAGSAFADSASLSVTNTAGESDPAAEVPRVFAVHVDTQAPEHVYIKYRNPGGEPCASTADTDPGRWFENYAAWEWASNLEVDGEKTFSHAGTWSTAGTSVFCIWLAQNTESIVTPITQTITFRSPTGTITATVNPATPRPGEKATVTVTGVSEASEHVYARVHMAGSTGCAPTYQAESGESLIEGSSVNGSFSVHATTMQSKAGQYVICLWLASSDSDTTPIAGPQPETFTVVSPPPPPPPPPPAPSAECLRDRSGVAHEELLMRRYEGRLRAHHLSKRTKRKDGIELADARKSASKYEGLRLHQCPSGK